MGSRGSWGSPAALRATAPATRPAGTSPGTHRRSRGGWPSRPCNRAPWCPVLARRSAAAVQTHSSRRCRRDRARRAARGASTGARPRPRRSGRPTAPTGAAAAEARRRTAPTAPSSRAPSRRGRRHGACGTTCGALRARRPWPAGRGTSDASPPVARARSTGWRRASPPIERSGRTRRHRRPRTFHRERRL